MFEAEREKVRVSEIAPVDDDEVGDRVVTACLDGASERAIAKRFGISVREVRQLVTERLASRNPEDHALEVGVEVARITQMQARLYAMTLAADDPTTMCSCAAVWNRLSERKGALRGHDIAPQRRDDRLTIVEAARPSMPEQAQALSAAVKALRSDPTWLRQKAAREAEAAAQAEDGTAH